jgi:hypothetical protein
MAVGRAEGRYKHQGQARATAGTREETKAGPITGTRVAKGKVQGRADGRAKGRGQVKLPKAGPRAEGWAKDKGQCQGPRAKQRAVGRGQSRRPR